MTAKELQQRNEKADRLRVFQTDDGKYFVESGEGKILYNVTISDSGVHCCCSDYTKNIKRDPDFLCKHILAVFNAVMKHEIEGAVFLKKQVPKLDQRWITERTNGRALPHSWYNNALIPGVALKICPRALQTYWRYSNHVVPLMV